MGARQKKMQDEKIINFLDTRAYILFSFMSKKNLGDMNFSRKWSTLFSEHFQCCVGCYRSTEKNNLYRKIDDKKNLKLSPVEIANEFYTCPATSSSIKVQMKIFIDDEKK